MGAGITSSASHHTPLLWEEGAVGCPDYKPDWELAQVNCVKIGVKESFNGFCCQTVIAGAKVRAFAAQTC